MSVVSLHRRSVRIVTASIAALSAAAGVSSSALAAHKPSPRRLQIVRPYHTDVAGTIFFSVRGIGPRAVRIVFSIDGRQVWSVARVTPRVRRATAIDTRKLHDGRHVLALRVTYSGGHTEVARKMIVVHNHHHRSASALAHPASAGGHAGSAGLHGGSSGGTAGSSGGTGGSTGSTSGTGGVVGPPATGPSGPPVAMFNREIYQYSSALSYSQEANRYQIMVMDGRDYADVAQLKAANPNLKILLYQAIMFTDSNDYSYMPTTEGCTAYSDDIANHPSWILHDQNGNPVIAPNTTDLYATDVGNPGYQQMCASNAAAMAKRYGFDGVFFDVVDGDLSYTLRPGISVPEYPTPASWQTAMGSALSYLGPALRAQGLMVFGNVSGNISTT
jgi:hypothetical protein